MEEALDGSQAGASATDVSGPGPRGSQPWPDRHAAQLPGRAAVPGQGHLKGTVLAPQWGLPEQTAAVLARQRLFRACQAAG